MKLYLSSFDLGNQRKRFANLVGTGKKGLLIVNAVDNRQEGRDKWLKSQTEGLQALGLKVQELDLRNYFGKHGELAELLAGQDFVWINGGNTFVLRRAMQYSGFDTAITKLVRNNSIVYGGFSAGVVLLYKDLHGLEITDDPNEISEGYNPEIVWDGLNLIDFAVAVHYDSDHPESPLTDKEIEYYETNDIPYKTLRDGEVIIIDGDNIELFG